jgi:hypothetical protein
MYPCDKVKYPNRKEARAAMRKFNLDPQHEIKAKSIYRCPYCKKHHFTTQNRVDSKYDRKYHIIQAHLLRKMKQIF